VGTLKTSSGSRLNDTLKGLDTPTLVGAFASGPYLHDGSAATLLDVITTANPEDKHGRTAHLSAAEKNQLVAFLLSLDREEGPGGAIRLGGSPRGLGSKPRLVLDRRGGSPRIYWPSGPKGAVWTDLQGRVRAPEKPVLTK
jgi:hypothetical protein